MASQLQMKTCKKIWTTSVLNKNKCENLISRKSKYVVPYNILCMKLFFVNLAPSELRNKTRAWCGLVVFIFGSDGEYELAQPIYWVEREVLLQRSWALPSFEERLLAGLRVCGFLLSCFVITADYTLIMSRTLTVTGDHVKFARFALLLPVKEQRHDFHFFRSMYNKGNTTIIRLGFCDIQNNQGLGKACQLQPSALPDNPYLDLDYSGYRKNLIQSLSNPFKPKSDF